jgi:hypothetical protein
MLAHGFTTALLAELIRDGLATVTAERVLIRRREIEPSHQ